MLQRTTKKNVEEEKLRIPAPITTQSIDSDQTDDTTDGHDEEEEEETGPPFQKLCRRYGTRRAIAASSNKMISRTNLLHPSRTELERKDSKWKTGVDWTEGAVNGEHLWYDSSNANNDFCYVSDADCNKVGPKKKCASCKIVIHKSCLSHFEKMNVRCRFTFREASVRNYRDGMQQQQNIVRHHWVHRRRQDGRCRQCGKSFQQKFGFNNKDVIAIGCSWCKAAYHNKTTCFQLHLISEHCSMGLHSALIVPPSWIVKIPKRNSFKSSVRRRRSRGSNKHLRAQSQCPFVVKQVPFSHIRPLLVFINPKSGGNQGVKLMQKFSWYLNPRQVFDLAVTGGPKKGLDLYRKVPNLRVLACGGDGTVGWILSEIDAMGITPRPPVAILPLGTGNDLSRMLGWGPGYTDEPVSKILNSIEEGRVAFLDRWNISVEDNHEVPPTSTAEESAGVTGKLPINVFNNYFSLGADAATTLEFHESREANPEKFNSRLRNKMFYAGCGGKDLLKRSWKDLCDHVHLICDGNDLTPKFRELKLHCLLFLNIEKYSSGANPWGSPNASTGFEPQSIDDGYLEVVGFTSTSLATLQVGGHGERLCQCRHAVVTTTKAIPVQVDGEPCRLRPSIISVSRRNQARIVMKSKRRISLSREDISDFGAPKTGIIPERLRLQVGVLRLADYEEFVFDSERLRAAAVPLGIVVVESDTDLHSMRRHVIRLAQDTPLISPRGRTHLSDKWLFLDSATSDRFFRIDKLQEKLHFVTDVAVQELYILDLEQSPFGASSLPRDARVGEVRLEISAESEDGGDLSTSESSQIVEELFIASAEGDVPTLERLVVKHPKMVLKALDEEGNTALHLASAAGHADAVKILLTDAPETFVNATNSRNNRTPLHLAVEGGSLAVCRRLMEGGALGTIEDSDGHTPFHFAQQAGRDEIMQVLSMNKTSL